MDMIGLENKPSFGRCLRIDENRWIRIIGLINRCTRRWSHLFSRNYAVVKPFRRLYIIPYSSLWQVLGHFLLLTSSKERWLMRPGLNDNRRLSRPNTVLAERLQLVRSSHTIPVYIQSCTRHCLYSMSRLRGLPLTESKASSLHKFQHYLRLY